MIFARMGFMRLCNVVKFTIIAVAIEHTYKDVHVSWSI